ncbi:holin-like protein [Geothermobacter ehrlichii]|uniref:Holin-like protein n=1 Tax=Geothermobacter ehrlichii TaxID=213224 RepID=A0A5D3WM85_9BACT|nr:CidA/LrgA family protein [Geothermobacter ehrlichii]TYP00103.1 holin-like protein [Geothermobacter ehrlichii]
MVRGLALLLGFQLLGELISRLTGIPIPGNVIGMALMLAALGSGLVRLAWVEEAAELLLSHLALFFIPAGVGVMVYGKLIAREWLPISVATVVSTFVVMAVTGKVAQRLEKGERQDAE